MPRIITPPLIGETQPPEYVAYDEVALREPRLLTPGQAPLGSTTINRAALQSFNPHFYVGFRYRGTALKTAIGDGFTETLTGTSFVANPRKGGARLNGTNLVWRLQGTTGSLDPASYGGGISGFVVFNPIYADSNAKLNIGAEALGGQDGMWVALNSSLSLAVYVNTSSEYYTGSAMALNSEDWFCLAGSIQSGGTYVVGLKNLATGSVFVASGSVSNTLSAQTYYGIELDTHRAFDRDHGLSAGAMWIAPMSVAKVISLLNDPYQFLIPA